MSREPMFKPSDDGTHYLLTLGAVLVLCGDAIFGDPAETTPEGRRNAERMLDRILREAEAHGFTQGDIVRALLKRNKPSARLMNLAREAVDHIPKHVQAVIMDEELGVDAVERTAPSVGPSAEPSPDPDALRPGPDGLDPRFLAAGQALELVRQQHGDGAIHRPEYQSLFVELMRFAPHELRQQMRAKMQELGLMPDITHVGENGQAVFSSEQIAATHGVPVEEVERLVAEHVNPSDLYTGPVHRVQ